MRKRPRRNARNSASSEELEVQKLDGSSSDHNPVSNLIGFMVSLNPQFQDLMVRSSQEITIGRAVDCSVRIRSREISANHCKLSIQEPSTVVLQDLSSNGTYLNGLKIGKNKSKIVKFGDVISFVYKERRDTDPFPCYRYQRHQKVLRKRGTKQERLHPSSDEDEESLHEEREESEIQEDLSIDSEPKKKKRKRANDQEAKTQVEPKKKRVRVELPVLRPRRRKDVVRTPRAVVSDHELAKRLQREEERKVRSRDRSRRERNRVDIDARMEGFGYRVHRNRDEWEADGRVRTIPRMVPGSRDPLFALQFVNRDFTADDYEALLALDKNNVQKAQPSIKDIDRIPSSFVEAESNLDDCCICLDPFEIGHITKQLACNHVFHAKCIDAWLPRSPTCPVCKANAFSVSQNEPLSID